MLTKSLFQMIQVKNVTQTGPSLKEDLKLLAMLPWDLSPILMWSETAS